jgi:hypothetical protein
VLDPGDGWWFQNFGRNLVFATEAFYHALFLGAILAVMRKRFRVATALAIALSASHPFTGIQLLAVLLAWVLLERVVLRRATVPRWFIVACLVLTLVHVAYYLVFLPTFPEHRQVMEQWKRSWILDPGSLVPAYGIVGALAFWRLRTTSRARAVLADPDARLLVMWFLVSIALSNHDLIMKPVQPLHFTRGYIWTPLFLLGAPTLMAWYQNVLERRPGAFGRLAAAVVTLVFVSDNLLWLADRVSDEALTAPHRSAGIGFAVTSDQWALLQWLNRPENARYVVVSEDADIGYLTTVYTSLRSWRSHENNTPLTNERKAELARFFTEGIPVDMWRVLPLMIVYRHPPPRADTATGSPRTADVAFRNSTFVVYRAPPADK